MNYFLSNNELYHYGVLGMKWGVRRYQPYPSGSKKGKEIGEAARAKRAAGLQKHYQKAVKKFNKIDTKREKWQQDANKKIAKAEKKSQSIFSTKLSVDKSFDKARDSQFEADLLSRKGEKWFRAMEKAFANTGLDFDPEVKAMGQKYIDTVANTSRIMTLQAFVLERKGRLEHSAKGSTWEEHKYIKRVDGTYYYPDNYEGGRHISDLEEKSNEDEVPP